MNTAYVVPKSGKQWKLPIGIWKNTATTKNESLFPNITNRDMIKFFTTVAAIGFFCSVLHPAMLVVFAIGVYGMRKYEEDED